MGILVDPLGLLSASVPKPNYIKNVIITDFLLFPLFL
jgi:hypothetical protein